MSDSTTFPEVPDDIARRFLAGTIGGDYIVVHIDVAAAVGGLYEAILLEYLLRWSRLTDDGWCYRTVEQIERETLLSPKVQRSARQFLQSNGFLDVQRRGVPAQNYYRPNFSAIVTHLCAGMDLDTVRRRVDQTADLDVPKGQIKSGPNGTSIYRETEEEQQKDSEDKAPAKKSKTAVPPHLIPDDWEPDDGLISYGTAQCGLTSAAVRGELDKFKLHHQSVGNKKVNWTQAAQLWLRNARDWDKGRSNGRLTTTANGHGSRPGPGETWADVFAREQRAAHMPVAPKKGDEPW